MAIKFPITFEGIKTVGVQIQGAIQKASKIKTVKVGLFVFAIITIVPIIGYLAYKGIAKIVQIRAEKKVQKEQELLKQNLWYVGIGAMAGIVTTVGVAGLAASALCATEFGTGVITMGVKKAISTNYGSKALMKALSNLSVPPAMTGLEKFAVLINYAYPKEFGWLNNIFNLPKCTGSQIISLLMSVKKSS